jgi:predicted PurR-regulated permease PerM
VDAGNEPSVSQDIRGKALDIAIRLGVVALIVFWCFSIFLPFLMPVAWGVLIAVALYPTFVKLKGLLGGRNRLAGTVFMVVSLVLVIVPTVLLFDSLIEGSVRIGRELQEGTFTVQPPPEKVKSWPLIGERFHGFWMLASENTAGALTRIGPQLRAFGNWFVATFTALGVSLVITLIALVIAGILMMNGAGGGRTARAIGRRLGGEKGDEMVGLAAGTIRSVVRGVLLVAAIQGLLAGIGLYVAGVPAAGFWAVLVLIVAVIQLPPILVLGPIAVYVFSVNDSLAVAIAFAVWSLIVSVCDSFLKPLLLGRGVSVPMPVILIGAIGGMIGSGVIGLFIGPVILAIGYEIFTAWIADGPENVGQ